MTVIFTCIGNKIHETLVDILLLFKKKQKEEFRKLKEMNSKNFLQFFINCILGPIIEEFTYRKLIIDRLAKYDKTLAIIYSGIIFGIIHKTFNNFFHALFSGFVYAYSYVQTSYIFIQISYHMAYNIKIFLEDYFDISLNVKDKYNQIIAIIGIIIGILLLVINIRQKIIKKIYKMACIFLKVVG